MQVAAATLAYNMSLYVGSGESPEMVQLVSGLVTVLQHVQERGEQGSWEEVEGSDQSTATLRPSALVSLD